MSGDPGKPNGSVDLLAQAMRKVFSEQVEGSAETTHSEESEDSPEDLEAGSAEPSRLW